MFEKSETQFLVNKFDISPQLSRAISGLLWTSIQNSTDCRNLLNFLHDATENDEIQLKKYALSKVFSRLRHIAIP